jgi:hypothetical protein
LKTTLQEENKKKLLILEDLLKWKKDFSYVVDFLEDPA